MRINDHVLIDCMFLTYPDHGKLFAREPLPLGLGDNVTITLMFAVYKGVITGVHHLKKENVYTISHLTLM